MNFLVTLPLAVTLCARLTWLFPGPVIPRISGGRPTPVIIAGGPERPVRPLITSRPSR